MLCFVHRLGFRGTDIWTSIWKKQADIPFLYTYIHTYIHTYIILYVCVCVRERERERVREAFMVRFRCI